MEPLPNGSKLIEALCNKRFVTEFPIIEKTSIGYEPDFIFVAAEIAPVHCICCHALSIFFYVSLGCV
jgi:hypothetical protein